MIDPRQKPSLKHVRQGEFCDRRMRKYPYICNYMYLVSRYTCVAATDFFQVNGRNVVDYPARGVAAIMSGQEVMQLVLARVRLRTERSQSP